MGKLTEQRQYRFTPEQLVTLLELATETNSVCKGGPTARQPSIATLFQRIADREISLAEVKPWSLPDGLAEQAQAIERERQLAEAWREQERRLEQERLVAEQQRRVAAGSPLGAAQKQVERKAPPVKLEQLSMLELEPA